MAVSTAGTTATPEARLRALIAKLDPGQQKLVRSVRAALRKRLPAANELVYDYAHSLVIGYTPSEHGIQAVVALSARADEVALYFNQGHTLPDPKKLLKGSGRQTRFIQVEAASELRRPEVEALIAAAIDRADVPLPASGRGKLIIRTDSSTKRPRPKTGK